MVVVERKNSAPLTIPIVDLILIQFIVAGVPEGPDHRLGEEAKNG